MPRPNAIQRQHIIVRSPTFPGSRECSFSAEYLRLQASRWPLPICVEELRKCHNPNNSGMMAFSYDTMSSSTASPSIPRPIPHIYIMPHRHLSLRKVPVDRFSSQFTNLVLLGGLSSLDIWVSWVILEFGAYSSPSANHSQHITSNR